MCFFETASGLVEVQTVLCREAWRRHGMSNSLPVPRGRHMRRTPVVPCLYLDEVAVTFGSRHV